MRTITLSLTDGQMASLFNLCEPLMDAFVERVALRVRELQEDAKPRYYSRQEVAALLHVSLPTIHSMVHAGVLHPEKVGGRVLFAAQDVDDAIHRGDLTRGQWRKKGGRL